MDEQAQDPQFNALLDFLKNNRGFDFTGYKPASLARRVIKRMGQVGLETFGDYLDYLQVHPEEFAPLFNTILINVTAFFRDPLAWEYVDKEVVPTILAGKSNNEPIRVWSAGCASGEEAYTLAIILAETLGLEPFRRRVKIYATDVDEEALALARQATYGAKDLELNGVSAELRDKYFEPHRNRYLIQSELRRPVIFGRHDLMKDAPISRIDLLVCRNTLMYFNAETQDRILSRFAFALNDNGFLFVGKAELMVSHPDRFIPVQLKHRVLRKTPTSPFRESPALPVPTHLADPVPGVGSRSLLMDTVFETEPIAQVVLDPESRLTQINEQVRTLLGLTQDDIGKPIHELNLLYRSADLLTRIERVFSERHPIRITNVPRIRPSAPDQYLDIELVPIMGKDGVPIGTSIFFHDMTSHYQLKVDHERAVQELETAAEELQTTNEELQSTNEELETTNEELQSANEEMETMNEELQSSNEELRGMNERLAGQSEEVKNAGLFMESILQSVRAAIVVMDQSLTVQKWNIKAEDLWGLRAEEARGQHFLNLDIGLPVEQLKGPIRACVAGESSSQQIILDAINRRGKTIRCSVTCMPLLGANGDIQGIILSMEDLET